MAAQGEVRDQPVLGAVLGSKDKPFNAIAKEKLVTTVNADASARSDSDATSTGFSDSDASTTTDTETKTDITSAARSRGQTSTDSTGTLQQTAKGVNEGTTSIKTDGEATTTGQGQDFGWTVSSSVLTGQVSTVPILPGNVARWWRQVERCRRRTYILLYNKCGQSSIIGTATMDDWMWGVELAQGPGKCRQTDQGATYSYYKKLSSYACALPDQGQCCLQSGNNPCGAPLK